MPSKNTTCPKPAAVIFPFAESHTPVPPHVTIYQWKQRDRDRALPSAGSLLKRHLPESSAKVFHVKDGNPARDLSFHLYPAQAGTGIKSKVRNGAQAFWYGTELSSAYR